MIQTVENVKSNGFGTVATVAAAAQKKKAAPKL
jgi:hypothetical protein